MSRSTNISVPGYDSDASRIEYCCVRCIYAIPLFIVGGIAMLLFGIVIGILSALNFFSILLLGRRIESLYNLTIRVTEWQAKVGLYMNGLTDERPPLIP